MPTLDTISRAFAGPMPWMYCSAITTRLLVGILTPAIRATFRSLLVTQEKRERRPGPSPRRSSRFVLRALSRKRLVIGIVAVPSTTETPIYERKRAGARPCPARVRTHDTPDSAQGIGPAKHEQG